MNIQTLLNKANKILVSSSSSSPKLDSEILLSEVINKNRQYLILNSNEELINRAVFYYQFLKKEEIFLEQALIFQKKQ